MQVHLPSPLYNGILIGMNGLDMAMSWDARGRRLRSIRRRLLLSQMKSECGQWKGGGRRATYNHKFFITIGLAILLSYGHTRPFTKLPSFPHGLGRDRLQSIQLLPNSVPGRTDIVLGLGSLGTSVFHVQQAVDRRSVGDECRKEYLHVGNIMGRSGAVILEFVHQETSQCNANDGQSNHE